MSDNKKQFDAPIAGHEYDGIQEFDNPLPRWWVQMFYLTIVFSIGYYGYYEFGPGKGLSETFDAEMSQAQVLRAQNAPKEPAGGDSAKLLAAVKDPGQVTKGKAVYTSKCASCHGAQGQGSIGPNLTDDHWIHGGKAPEIAKTVAEGVAAKGMPPWGSVISADELVQVVAYVKSLRGTNPPNAKAPEGPLVKDM